MRSRFKLVNDIHLGRPDKMTLSWEKAAYSRLLTFSRGTLPGRMAKSETKRHLRYHMTERCDYLRLHGPIRLASADTKCWKCHRTTRVHTLMAEDLEEFAAGEEPMRMECSTFVYEVGEDAMPPALHQALAVQAPNFKSTHSGTAGGSYWASQCTECGAVQGAFYQHSEPDGPFFGGPVEFSGDLVVLSDDGFDIDDASYST